MTDHNKIVLKHAVEGAPEDADFELRSEPLPEPGDGEMLIRHTWLSLDPYMGSAIKGRHMSGAIPPGGTMPGETLGIVVKSRHPDYPEGATVLSRGGWQEYSIAPAPAPGEAGMVAALSHGARQLDVAPNISPSVYLGALGMPGLTGFAGVTELLAPKPGETFVVSAASGAVGSTAGQVARHMGARVVGIAGSPEKCAYVIERFGFDACVNYKSPDWKARLAEACPGGIDAYFDTAGGLMLQAAMGRLAMNARIILCGMMDQYKSAEILPGPNLGAVLARRASIRGLVVYDHWEKMPRWRALATQWMARGEFAYKEHRVDGLAAAPKAFADMMAGRNFGKTVVAIR
jgi:NADPH-dependent curcumin reductase CurA